MLFYFQEEDPEVEYVEDYEMEEDDDDAMEDFAKGANRMSDTEDGEFISNITTFFSELFPVLSRLDSCM